MKMTQMTLKLFVGLALAVSPTFGLMAKPSKDAPNGGGTPKESVLTGPYGLRIAAAPGCEKGAKYVLQRLMTTYLPHAVRYYGDPFAGKEPSRVFTIRVKRNDGSDARGYTGPSWGSCSDGIDSFTIGLAKGADKWEMDLTLAASLVLTVCQDAGDAVFSIYVNKFIDGDVRGVDPVPEIKDHIRKGLAKEGDEKKDRRLWIWRKFAPMWSVFEELRERHPQFMLDYCKLKNLRYAEGKLPQKLSFGQMATLLGEATGEDMAVLFEKYGVEEKRQKNSSNKLTVVQKLQTCDFLLNKDFKKDAKYYLCLFSASWCGPCRREMPRIAKTYAEQLKSDPDIELIHFSRDQNDEKALAWAKEHDVKFPIVKPQGGNPLDLHSRGIPHLFIVKADGTLQEEGHPMRLFTDEKLRELKRNSTNSSVSSQSAGSTTSDGNLKATVGAYTWFYRVNNGEATIEAKKDDQFVCAVSPVPTGHITIPSSLNGMKVTAIGNCALSGCAGLTSVTIPEGVRSVGNDAFLMCSMETVSIPASVTKVHDGAFSCNSALKSFSVDASNPSYTSRNGVLLSKDGKTLISGVNGDVVIPPDVQTIVGHAFRGRHKLKSVVIPQSVTVIGGAAFWQCRGLTSVTLPQNLRRLECSALRETGLKSITIPPSVTDISWSLLYGCGELSSVTLPQTATHISGIAFMLCKKLESITIPASVKRLDGRAFESCPALLSVTICGECPTASESVFPNCPKLKEIHVPANSKSWAGMKDWQGKKLLFDGGNPPETATEKTRKAISKLFPGWSLDTEVLQHEPAGFHTCHRGQNDVVCVHPKSMETPAIISRTVRLSDKNPCLFLNVASWNEEADYLLSVRVNGKDALPVRLICTPNFEPWQDIVVSLSDWRKNEVKIEVVLAANNWWYENPMLARLEIAEGKGDMRITEGTETANGYTWSYRAQNGEATIIAEKDGKFSRAVSPCPVGQLTIPATLGGAKVTRIGREALRDCSAVSSVTIPESVTRIGRDAFRDCTGIKSISVPQSVKVLEWGAFAGCNALLSVTLPSGLANIDRGAFWWCCALSSISIPSSVTHIGQDAFLHCKCLTALTIPAGITDIKWRTFCGCNALTSMTIPASVTNINHTTFCDTGAMTAFRVEESNRFYKSENGLLLTKDGTTLVRGVNGDVKIPSSVTAIGPCAFEGCVSLRPIVIPNGVKSIGDYAFKQCRSMTSVTIPEGVTSIGRESFNACRGLDNVMIPESMTSIGNFAFWNCSGLTSITIPPCVRQIGNKAFHGCGSLTSATFSSSLKNIDRKTFENCSKLKSVKVIKDGETEIASPEEFFKRRESERDAQRRELLKIQKELKRAREEKTSGRQRAPDRPGLLNRNRPRNLQAVPASCPQPRNAEMEEQRRQLQEIQAQLKALKAEQDRMKAEKSSGK